MGEIQVDFGALESGHQGIQQTFGRLQSSLDELETGLQPMIETWSGAAQEQYLLCKKQWDSAATDLAAVLGSVASAVASANENYTSTHDATVRIWS